MAAKDDKTEKLDLSEQAILRARQEQQADLAREQNEAAASKASAKEDKSKVTKIEQVDVLIFRNEFTSIPDTVFKHELRILEALHGTDSVRVIGEDEVEVYDFNANDELARLQRKYNSKELDAVGAVYQNDPRQLAKEAGVSFERSEARKPATSSQTPGKKKALGKKK